MARSAVCAELTVVCILCRVTGVTILRRPFENIVDMTRFTTHVHVQAGQGEGCLAVIEGHIFPAARIVALGAERAKLLVVSILCRVAREAILRRPLINFVRMAGGARHIYMQPRQLEIREIVIEMGGQPAICGMALRTIGA
jgi:hypothetical protein